MTKITKGQKAKALVVFQNMTKVIRRDFDDNFNPYEIKIDANYDKSLLYRKWLANPYSTLIDNGNKTYELAFSEHLWYEIVVD